MGGTMSIVLVGSTSGSITLQEPAVAGTTVLDLPATSGTLITTGSTTGINASAISTGVVPQANGGTGTTTGFYNFKNRIINGAMVIDQRNAGASVNNAVGDLYTLDRWTCFGSQASKFTVQQNAGSVTPPVGFKNYLGVTSSSAYSVGASEAFRIAQWVEGFNVADLDFGTANAKTVTISFWVRSSLTGTFGAQLLNSGASRVYPFTYTISSANTWEYKTVTVAGDTTGTWLTNNGQGLLLGFGLGYGSSVSGTANAWNGGTAFMPTGATSVVGTNGATFYITGVQLEVGSTATSFDYRPYGTELVLCQRYYQTVETVSDLGVPALLRRESGSNVYAGNSVLPTRMRASASVSYTFTQVHKPGIAYEGFSSVTVDASATEWFMQLTPNSNNSNCIACFPRTGGFQFSAEL